jgi:hypothetical protein
MLKFMHLGISLAKAKKHRIPEGFIRLSLSAGLKFGITDSSHLSIVLLSIKILASQLSMNARSRVSVVLKAEPVYKTVSICIYL